MAWYLVKHAQRCFASFGSYEEFILRLCETDVALQQLCNMLIDGSV